MDALQDAALAPFDLVDRRLSCGMLEGAAHGEALHLHGEEGLEDGGGIESEAIGEGAGGDGAGDL